MEAAAAAAADQNSSSTAATVADFVISYALQLVALLVYLQIHLIKLCAVLMDGLCAHLLSSLNQILPPGSRIHSIHHYLTEFEALATAYLDYFVAKYCEIYPLVQRYTQIKLEESIRNLTEFEALATAYLDYFVAKYCEIYPLVQRYFQIKLEESIRYMEARKQEYESIKSEERIVRFVSQEFGLEEKTARVVIAGCFTVAIGFVCVRLWRCGTRSKTMKAPGRGGATMRRSDFAGDPKGYFRSLRARN